MTAVIDDGGILPYSAGMKPHDDLQAMLAQQRALTAWLDALGGDVVEVLALGAEVLRFAEHEERAQEEKQAPLQVAVARAFADVGKCRRH